MKKPYQKPVIMIENFTLSDYIAACGSVINLTAGCSNVIKDNGEAEFFMSYGGFNDSCELKISDYEDEFGICYHTPQDSVSVVFNS